MRYLGLFVVVLLTTTFSLSKETTLGLEDSLDQIEESNRCVGFENKFRKQVLKDLERSLEQYSFFEECLSSSPKSQEHPCLGSRKAEVDSFIKGVKKYRLLAKKFYENLALQWVERLPQGQQELAEKCFFSQSSRESIQNEKKVAFDNHLRVLKIQIQPETSCFGLRNLWASDLNRRITEGLENPRSLKLSQNEVDEIKSFQTSFGAKLFSATTKDNPNLDRKQLRESLYADFQRMKDGLNKFKSKMSQLKDSELYLLYDFEHQHKHFMTRLNAADQLIAKSCRKESSFLKDCVTRRSISGRCGSRVWGVAKEFLPIVGLVDAMAGYDDVKAAQAAGVMTQQEAQDKSSQLSMQFLLGLPVGGIAGIGTQASLRVAARNSRPIKKRVFRFVTEEKGALHLALGKMGDQKTVSVLEASGIRSKALERLPKALREKTLNELSESEATNVMRLLDASARKAIHEADPRDAIKIYENSYQLAKGVAARAATRGNSAAVDAHLTKAFAYRGAMATGRKGKRLSKDTLFDQAHNGGYFFRKLKNKSFSEVYDPSSKLNKNLYGVREMNRGMDAQSLYLNINRQLQELRSIQKVMARSSYDISKLPEAFKEVSPQEISKYIRVYQRNLNTVAKKMVHLPR